MLGVGSTYILKFFSGLVAGCHPFCLFFIVFFYNIHTYIYSITFIQYIYPSPFAGASLHLLIAWKLSGKTLPVVPSRESNSGLPYIKVIPFSAFMCCHSLKWVPTVWELSQVIFYLLLGMCFSSHQNWDANLVHLTKNCCVHTEHI